MRIVFQKYDRDYSIQSLHCENQKGKMGIHCESGSNDNRYRAMLLKSAIGAPVKLDDVSGPLQAYFASVNELAADKWIDVDGAFQIYFISSTQRSCSTGEVYLCRISAFSYTYDRSAGEITIYDSKMDDPVQRPFRDIRITFRWNRKPEKEERKAGFLSRRKEVVYDGYRYALSTDNNELYTDGLVWFRVTDTLAAPVTVQMLKRGAFYAKKTGRPDDDPFFTKDAVKIKIVEALE